MSIFSGSRYENAKIDFVKTTADAARYPVLFYTFPNIGSISYIEYEWKNGDRLDLVAEKFYGDSDSWWFILQYNPEIRDPQNIPAGKKLRIVNA